MEQADIVIIGAGIVGLSIAVRLSDLKCSVYVVERHDSFGQETSSRNSEVIHAGIYYPSGSLKAKTCVKGNKMLYEICSKNRLACKRIGKLIVATNGDEENVLTELLKRGQDNGVEGLKILSEVEVKRLEPNVKAMAALYSPSTGITDSHNLMRYFIQYIKEKGSIIAHNSNVSALNRLSQGYEVTVTDNTGDEFNFQAKILNNCAGFNSDCVAQMVGIDIERQGYSLKYCKGQYFRLRDSQKATLVNRLIYLTPEDNAGSLGIHATPDLWGGLRLGSDSHYITRDKFDYEVDILERRTFFSSAARLLPFLDEEDLIPDTAGIRPKLQGPDEDFRDFVIKEESELGFPGFINLIGIESPGLTSAPAIATYVENFVEKII